MGKSPGKWIKGILFGKKKGRELSRSASEKPVRVTSKESVSPLILDAPLNSEAVAVTVIDKIQNSGSEKEKAGKLQNDGVVSPGTHQGVDMPATSEPDLENDSENMSVEQAATVVQNLQAQDSSQNLEGIIKLQSLIRGHLVRRQAVATLFCVQRIVKFQAVARGHMVRRSNNDVQCTNLSLVAKEGKLEDSCESSKWSLADSLSGSAFICELLSSSATSMPLRLQYGPGEPNSAWAWLRRWSKSQVWASTLKPKETCESNHQAVETEKTKPNRNTLRKRSVNAGSGPNHAKSESDKLKPITKKFSSQLVKSQNQPPVVNDKVKRGHKKSPEQPAAEMPNEAWIDVEKPKRNPNKSSKSEIPKSLDQTVNPPSDKPSEESEAAVSKHVDDKSSLEHLDSQLASEEHPKPLCDKTNDSFPEYKDLKDDKISVENYHLSQTISFPSKSDDQPEATPENVKKVPSYMATTASSKAKVKAQASLRFNGLDAVDRNDLTRRHSLPSSIGAKMSSSPRVHRLVQANGSGHKVDRSLSSSRDVTEKVIQPDWKR